MFFLINKPIGISSFGAIARLRKILGIKKVGHTGTLDPLASGLLLVATGNSTKLIPYIDRARKTYIFTVRLDGTTPSLDLDTPVKYIDPAILSQAQEKLTIWEIEKIIADEFSWVIEQIPPAYSAIRVDGQRSYKLVRQWQDVVLQKRKVEIFSARVVSFDFPEITIEMEVSAGTYIRSIARDLAVRLGLSGHVTRLHRSQIVHLHESHGKRVEDITEADAILYEQIFPDFAVITPSPEVIGYIRNGLVFPNTLGLEPGRKYLVKEGEKYVSLIEDIWGNVKICANSVE